MEKNKNIDEVLLTKYLLEETTEEEGKVVELWISSSPENKEVFDAFKKVWEVSNRINIPSVNVDVDKAWNRMASAIEEVQETKEIKFTSWRRIASSIAAVLLLAIGLNTYLEDRQVEEVSYLETYKVDVPKVEQLHDGSSVTINANSTLSVASFEGNSRKVTLEGEAYFEIAHDESKPFIVHTLKGDITVLGTKFNVKATKDDVVVTVTEGLVKLASIGQNEEEYVLLEKHTEGVIDKNNYVPQKKVNVSQNNLFWKTEALTFKNEMFSDAVKTLENAYNITINVRNEKLNHKKLTVDFKGNTIEEVFEILQATYKVQVQKIGEKTYSID